MKKSRPIDRCCPLWFRRANGNHCLRIINGNESIPLLMGCPDPCVHRDIALENEAVRAQYERCKRWDEAT